MTKHQRRIAMSKKTVINMKLIIIEMKKQIQGNTVFYESLRILSSSYENLLRQLRDSNEDFKGHKLTEDIKSQLKEIENINKKLESESIPEILKTGNYSGVNNLTKVTTNLHSITNSLSRLLVSLYSSYNPKILIVSNNRNISEEFLYKLLEERNEIIIDKLGSASRGSLQILTDKNAYSAIEFSENFRGRRMDFIYLDDELTLEQMNLISMTLKDKKAVSFF